MSTTSASGGFNGSTEGAVAVGNVGGLCVKNSFAQAMPQHLQPPVAKGAQSCVMALASSPLGVVELARPGGASKAAECPRLHRVAEETVVGETAGDDELALARAARHRCLARVGLQRVRRLELFGMIADLAGDLGGEAVTEARKLR